MKNLVLLLVGCFLVSGNLLSEEREDPTDIWYRGFLATQKAEELVRQEEFLQSLSALNEAFNHYKQLALRHPEFHAENVRDRLQQTAEDRIQIKASIKSAVEAEDETAQKVNRLEAELEELKNQLRELRKRRELLDRELEELEGAQGEVDLGFNLDWQGRIELPSLHELLDKREKGLFSGSFLESELFPDGRVELEDEDGTKVVIKEPATSRTIPENWIPRLYDGEMTYLIPLVETLETKRFSKIIPVPVTVNDSVK